MEKNMKYIYIYESLYLNHCTVEINTLQINYMGFPGGPVVKNPSVYAGDTRDAGLIPRWGRHWSKK